MGSIPVRVTMKKALLPLQERFFHGDLCGNRKAAPAKQGKKVSGGHSFRPWEIPRIPERSPQDCETESGFVRVTMRRKYEPCTL